MKNAPYETLVQRIDAERKEPTKYKRMKGHAMQMSQMDELLSKVAVEVELDAQQVKPNHFETLRLTTNHDNAVLRNAQWIAYTAEELAAYGITGGGYVEGEVVKGYTVSRLCGCSSVKQWKEGEKHRQDFIGLQHFSIDTDGIPHVFRHFCG